ncbi:MAG: hypothetical protein H7210_10045, partial [Pyrinomonadaceae bacterium]|nr:hypothetical protein [Phycisphaerales bacterium]
AARKALQAERAASDAARAETMAWQERLTHAHAAHAAALAKIAAAYEAKPVVRLSRAVHRVLDRLPGPLSRAIKAVPRRAAKMISGR